MKKSHWIILSVGLALVLGTYIIPGTATQQAASPPLPFQVAVVDLAQVIRAHPGFTAAQAQLQEEVRQAGERFQARENEIMDLRRRIDGSGLRQGSAEHAQALDQFNLQMAQFEVDVQAQRRRFILRESQIMYDTHKDIKETIARYAQRVNIAQVTDYRDFDVDPANPESVAEDMDQRLVWFNQNLNITPFIIQQLYAERQMPVPPAIAERLRERLPIR